MLQLVALTLLLTAGCRPAPIISGISDSAVTIEHPGASSDADIVAKAAEGCALYGRKAQSLSYQCGDGYCIRKRHLFACMGPAQVQQVGPETSVGAAANRDFVDCITLNGGTVPTTAMGCLQLGGRLAGEAREASPAASPAGDPTEAVQETLEPATPGDADLQPREGVITQDGRGADDPCAAYAPGTIERVRCGWVTGSQRDAYVPAIGRTASLRVQMDCIPFRDEEARYRSCLERAS